ncbi:hypothetical protein AVEN_183057-1 [Araneus ventricosus]|uniref:Uncharacterized protein n=1 Tax=Araneus ventricosus TaxID=182803 RepID=A0A4Y2UY72_ARAVE|nr:hypothetical protein AVEN_167137-1 [Araneus ventricosus]GBO17084.1 hypothetical protein AVEN_183057-1 [Araneus ventricosus]
MENEGLFTNVQEKHVAQETIVLAQIINANRQQFTGNNSSALCYLWNDLAHSWRTSSPNRDIEKIPATLKSHISPPKSPNFSPSRQDGCQGQGSRRGCCRSSHTYPCKTLFLTIRLTLLGSDFPCL